MTAASISRSMAGQWVVTSHTHPLRLSLTSSLKRLYTPSAVPYTL